MYKFMMKSDYEIKCWISLRKVLNFHTCFMSFLESKAKRFDKHSISSRGSRRTPFAFQVNSFYSLFFFSFLFAARDEKLKSVFTITAIFSRLSQLSWVNNEVYLSLCLLGGIWWGWDLGGIKKNIEENYLKKFEKKL